MKIMPDQGEFLELIRMQLGNPAIRLQDRFIADLGVESFDQLRLSAAVEHHFKLTFPEEELSRVRTVGDLWKLVAADPSLGRSI